MWKYVHTDELFHYGVKGMKWGVRRTPEQLGHLRKKRVEKLTNSDIIKKNIMVKDAIASGLVSTKVNKEKQARHIKNGKGYIEGRSYMYGTMEDVQDFIDKYSGTGEPVTDKDNNWNKKERVVADIPSGKLIDPKTGEETETDKVMIVYSRTGSHAYPRKDE